MLNESMNEGAPVEQGAQGGNANKMLMTAFEMGLTMGRAGTSAPVAQAQPEQPKYPSVTDNGASVPEKPARFDIPSVF